LVLSIYANIITSNKSNDAVDPPPPDALIVTCPVEPEIVTFVPATIEVTIPVRLVPDPENEVAVIIPEVLILAVVENPRAVVAVVAVPVRDPLNVVAVTLLSVT